MDKIEFYKICDELLGQSHPPPTNRRVTRWGPRTPGAGRYEGYGLIRWFSENHILLAVSFPEKIQKTLSAEEVIKIIKTWVSK